MKISKKHDIQDILELCRKAVFALGLIAFFAGSAVYGAHFYLSEYGEKISAKKTSDIGLKDDVAVNFSVPVMGKEYLKDVKVFPEEKISVNFDRSNRNVVITPIGFWKPESEYMVMLPAGKTTMLTNFPSQKISFKTQGYPRISKISPSNSSKDVIIDTEEPITVDFDKSTKGFFVKFDLSPQSELAYENNAAKTQFRLLPKGAVLDGTHYELKISIKPDSSGDENYRQIYTGYFDTLPAAPVAWEKDFTLRLEQAKRFTKPKISQGKYIDVNLAEQIMTLFEDGKILDAYMVSSGKRGMETPKGEHQIYNKAPRAYSREYGLYMPNWMAITASGAVGIHELPEWPNGYKEGAAHLGIPVSHGCIRLGVGPAKRAFDWADIGTKVIVY